MSTIREGLAREQAHGDEIAQAIQEGIATLGRVVEELKQEALEYKRQRDEAIRLLKKASGAVAEIHAHDIGCPDCPSVSGDDPPYTVCPLFAEIAAAIAMASR